MGGSRYSSGADKLGIASAVICTVHCLVVPFAFLVKHSFDGGMPFWWEILDYVFLAVSLVAVYHASSHAAGRSIKYLLWVFWACLAIAIFFEDQLHWMAYVASAGLVATHVANIRRHLVAGGRKSRASVEPVVAEQA